MLIFVLIIAVLYYSFLVSVLMNLVECKILNRIINYKKYLITKAIISILIYFASMIFAFYTTNILLGGKLKMIIVLLFLIYIILCIKTIEMVDKILDKKNLSTQEHVLHRMIIKFAIVFILTILIVILGLMLHILL